MGSCNTIWGAMGYSWPYSRSVGPQRILEVLALSDIPPRGAVMLTGFDAWGRGGNVVWSYAGSGWELAVVDVPAPVNWSFHLGCHSSHALPFMKISSYSWRYRSSMVLPLLYFPFSNSFPHYVIGHSAPRVSSSTWPRPWSWVISGVGSPLEMSVTIELLRSTC